MAFLAVNQSNLNYHKYAVFNIVLFLQQLQVIKSMLLLLSLLFASHLSLLSTNIQSAASDLERIQFYAYNGATLAWKNLLQVTTALPMFKQWQSECWTFKSWHLVLIVPLFEPNRLQYCLPTIKRWHYGAEVWTLPNFECSNIGTI